MRQHAVDAWSVAGLDVWARDGLGRLAGIPAVHRIGIALAEGGGRRLLFVASDRDNEPDVDWCHVDAYADVPLNTAVRTGDTVAGSLDQLARGYEEFIERQSPEETPSIAAVPIIAAGQILGAFVLFYSLPQRFEQSQLDQLRAVGSQLGFHLRALQRARTRAPRSLVDDEVPPGAHVAHHRVPAEHAAVRSARHFLTETLTQWAVDEDITTTAELCLSELVTNALIHTSAGCEVRLVLDDGVLTVSVRDSGATVVTSHEPTDPLQVHGRGLQVVEALAARWGSDLDDRGTTVWFVLDADRP